MVTVVFRPFACTQRAKPRHDLGFKWKIDKNISFSAWLWHHLNLQYFNDMHWCEPLLGLRCPQLGHASGAPNEIIECTLLSAKVFHVSESFLLRQMHGSLMCFLVLFTLASPRQRRCSTIIEFQDYFHTCYLQGLLAFFVSFYLHVFSASASGFICLSSRMSIIQVSESFCTGWLKGAKCRATHNDSNVPCVLQEALDLFCHWAVQAFGQLDMNNPYFKATSEIYIFLQVASKQAFISFLVTFFYLTI